MKIKKLKLKNFAKFTDFEIEFNENITRLVGFNGSGKTTIGLTAIWAGLKGIAEKSKDSLFGERFRFIGPGKASSDIEIILKDEIKNVEIKVKNHITNQTNCYYFKRMLYFK
jgi:predicted ATP-binding protein involved in virulence